MLSGCRKTLENILIEVSPNLQGTGIVMSGITSLAFSHDDRFIAVGSGEGSLQIWDITRGRRLRSINAGSNAVTSVAFNFDSRFVSAGFLSGEIAVWDFYRDETGDKDVSRVSTDAAFPAAALMQYKQTGNVLEITAANRIQQITVTENITAACVNSTSTRLLTGSDSGIVRLWNLLTGDEIVQYINFGSEWISLLPTGFYNASPHGDELMKVEAGGQTFSMAQFASVLFRPDLQSKAVLENRIITTEESLQTLLMPENTPPLVEIIGSRSLNVSEGSALVRVKITANTGGIGRMKVTRDDVLAGYMSIEGLVQRQYTERGKQIYEISFTTPLEPGFNRIGISVFGERRLRESNPAFIDINTSWVGTNADKPDLHVLLMSIQTYQNSRTSDISNLRYTKADADALGALFIEQERGTLYRNVHIYQYTDENITKDGFQQIFNDVSQKVERDDSFVFFFAGHGFVDNKTGDFFFIPYDSIGFFSNPMEKNIVMDDIVGGITSVHAKNSLMLLDTCQSGTLLESGDTAFEKLIRQLNQKAIITATMGNQDAIESSIIGHGIFTASLLDSYLYKLENQYSAVSDMIDFTLEDVPNKFALITQEAASRGMNIEVISQTQKPMAFKPKENFDIFDRYTEPSVIEIRSITSGTVSIFRLPDETVSIGANGVVEKRLTGGTYRISMEYPDNHIETREVTVSNTPKTRPGREVVRFDYLRVIVHTTIPSSVLPVSPSPSLTQLPLLIKPEPPSYSGSVSFDRNRVDLRSDNINLSMEQLEQFRNYLIQHVNLGIRFVQDDSGLSLLDIGGDVDELVIIEKDQYGMDSYSIPIKAEIKDICALAEEFLEYGGRMGYFAYYYYFITIDKDKNRIILTDSGM